MSYPLELDGDGYYDTLAYDSNLGAYDGIDTGVYGGGGAGEVYGLGDSMPGGFGAVGGYSDLDFGVGLDHLGLDDSFGGGYGDSWLGSVGGHGDDYLWENMSYLDQELPLYQAWGDHWTDDNYALADLMHYQRQLEFDTALNEEERLRRWEDRLRWESLDEAERSLRYRSMEPYHLSSLGLAGGFWGHRLGGRAADLSYLRNIQLTRGLFAAPYRTRFSRYSHLGRRYSPYFSRGAIRPYAHQRPHSIGGVGLGGGLGRRQIPPHFGSRPLAAAGAGAMLSLREQELRTRLTIAETRATLTSLPATLRAQALADARRIKESLLAEQRLARSIDREELRIDAVEQAREEAKNLREMRADEELDLELRRLDGRGRGGFGW